MKKKCENEHIQAKTELDEYVKRNRKLKKSGIVMSLWALSFIPILVALVIIGSHSHTLITEKVQFYSIMAIVILIIILIIGLLLIFKSRLLKFKKRISLGMFIYLTFFSIYVTMIIMVLFLLYGNYDVKRFIITVTSKTQYCKWFYDEQEIDKIIEEINTNQASSLNDNSYYEKIISEKENDALYKVVKFTVNDCDAYLAIVYDASKVAVVATSKLGLNGEYVLDIAKRSNASIAINGGGSLDDKSSEPVGIVIQNNKVISDRGSSEYLNGGLIGLNKQNKLVLLDKVTANEAITLGVRDAITYGPFLIVDGVAVQLDRSLSSMSARTAIGQRADGIVLMLVIDSDLSRTKGASYDDVISIMQKYGAVNAASLDGGTASVMVVSNQLLNNPITSSLQKGTTPVSTAFIVSN